MILVDVNLLVYAVNRDTPMHRDAFDWWRRTIEGAEPVGLAWLVVLGFVRIATNPRVFAEPLTPEAALGLVDEWLEVPTVRTVEPTERHWQIFEEILIPLGTAANLTSDAHLAALAIEHGATLCSADGDFARFPNLRFRNPLAPHSPRRRR